MLDRVQTVVPASSIGKVLAGGSGLLPDALVITRQSEGHERCGRKNRKKS